MCYDSNARPPVPAGDAGPTRAEDLVLTAADGNRFAAYIATPDGAAPRAQVVILPDVRGLHHFYKELAVRFAEQGIAALAIDYFGRTAGLTPRDDSFEFMPHVQQIRFDTFMADVNAALGRLRSFLTGAEESGTTGLAGVIGFYAGLARDFGGAGTVLDRAMSIQYPLLGLFGGADQGIPTDQVETLDHELGQAGVEHEIVTYPGAPHSFFDRRAADFAEASADAWTRVLGFIAAHS